ncbi:hypothetical protein K9U39_01255 [Rhodoblastus acidophilus]|uniref:Uncharacterized protein n=1 Tax=Candidatus Rhodoblastus alkanivorans TaxID=2954117 RepID=A0ABS9Z3S8_9HYPH|nr:hypothetical protein [Candidatus Rhodoblastus alkanivorans]MCI4680200.1 hypothetical protein [Candidatus Rhodoblastus alkanivorans]MCI4682278.1 hypothetical protein [Candidatus Rhodoblastus alkanivorans]MDI4639580.1 hypothetical protein [Rhodoblastus acidophilus]
MKLRLGPFFACLLFAQAPLALANDKPPSAADLLFDTPQLTNTKPGDELDYSYSQKSSDPAKYGDAFDDKIKLMIQKASHAPDERTVDVQMFSGERRKPAGPFEDMTGNPALVLMLENNIQQLSALLHGNPRYFKSAIRRALRSAQSAPDKIEGQDKAWRVEVAPFKDDPQKSRMLGLDGMTYVFRVAPNLPGVIYEIDIAAHDPSGAVLMEEKLRYDGKKS